MALQTITKDILTRISGAALLSLPYDISFLAGYNAVTAQADEEGYIDTVCTGAPVIVDIEKNSGTIYSVKPQFADGVANNKITAGVLSTTTFVAGDRITFKVTAVGDPVIGKGVRFMLKCKV